MTLRLRISIILLAAALAIISARCDLPVVLAAAGPYVGDVVHSDPVVTVRGASQDELARLGKAVAVFSSADLELPTLEISFPGDSGSCGDVHGRFHASDGVMQIGICSSEMDWVYVHELAHAWERANVNDEQRQALVELRGLKQWRDPEAPWKERGVEWAAVAIQQGLTGLPLPPVLSTEMMTRLEAFELLTGQVAPILVSWVKTRAVPCDERPTRLSRPLTDASNQSCS